MIIKNDIFKTVSSLCILFCLISYTVEGQPLASGVTHPKYPAAPGERIRLLTDRGIYCVNEKVFFTAEYSCIEELESLSWSRVLYVELIRWNGTSIAGTKLRLTGESISSGIVIPGNIPSGNYYLRAYTRWMRNYPPERYAYAEIKIVNPFRPDTDEGPAQSEATDGAGTLTLIQKSLTDGITCTTDKESYKPGEQAEVTVVVNGINPEAFGSYCITVSKAGTTSITDNYTEAATDAGGDLPTYIEYLPEIRGITISGQVTDRNEGLPLQGVPVSLSETRSGEYYATYNTDERGRFVFVLPEMGRQHDFFVQAEVPSRINIDNGFCNQPIRLPYKTFEMSRDEADYVREVMVNQQITEKFYREKEPVADRGFEKASPQVFYGSKKAVYKIDKYIELPDVREFIFELVLEANIINDSDRNSVISLRRADGRYYPPLIFMDNIRVDASEQLLKVPLSRIERVEVINADYLVGNTQYYGIMSFYSVNRDFAGLDLNKNSLFFSYDLFSDVPPVAEFVNIPEGQRTPDRRNLLYWNPDIRLPDGGKLTISFTASDCTGDYEVVVRSKGHPDMGGIYGKCHFRVD